MFVSSRCDRVDCSCSSNCASGGGGMTERTIAPSIASQLDQCSISGSVVPARGTTVLCVRKDDQVGLMLLNGTLVAPSPAQIRLEARGMKEASEKTQPFMPRWSSWRTVRSRRAARSSNPTCGKCGASTTMSSAVLQVGPPLNQSLLT